MTTTDSIVPRAAAGTAARDRAPIALRAAQLLLLVPLGAFLVFASIYFAFVEPPQTPRAIDWLIGAWAFTIGVGNLYAGARLGHRTPAIHRAALMLIVSHILFGIIKVVGYDEQESATFIVIDLLALALLLSPPVRRFLKRD